VRGGTNIVRGGRGGGGLRYGNTLELNRIIFKQGGREGREGQRKEGGSEGGRTTRSINALN
jgi:hypothetical protein